MSLLVSFPPCFCNSECFGRSLPIFRSYFTALVAVGLTNECVIVWCGVRWLVQSSRSLHGAVWEGTVKLVLFLKHSCTEALVRAACRAEVVNVLVPGGTSWGSNLECIALTRMHSHKFSCRPNNELPVTLNFESRRWKLELRFKVR
jgi:hypothetical protein